MPKPPLRSEPKPVGAAPGPAPAAPLAGRVTLRTLESWALEGKAFACLTCYDATTARWLERAGVPVLLVGDTAAEVILGFERTTDMPLEILLALTAAVRRGAPHALVMGDMPFLTYHASTGAALRNAGRFLTEGRADCVKIEADASFAPLVKSMTRAGIPVCAHVGSRPQLAGLRGGYGSAGRTADEAASIVGDALALERAGASLLLVEAVPPVVAAEILAQTRVPLIGIGAGPACDGQVLVLQDLVGMSDTPPRFAEPTGSLGAGLVDAARSWIDRVERRDIGGREYVLPPDEDRAFEQALRDSALSRRTPCGTRFWKRTRGGGT
ncbi:MAG: 3-methyl-2-oxobutanoate hydroxymethyltransferase [Phycisphaerales bacterium]|nr:3-methyl-2-oxobutanoate hydroxymethyltransferase [Phycisphaerales bacterium]